MKGRRIPSPENRRPRGTGFPKRRGPRVPSRIHSTPEQRAMARAAKLLRITPKRFLFELLFIEESAAKSPAARGYVRAVRSIMADFESLEDARTAWKRYEKLVKRRIRKNAMEMLTAKATQALHAGNQNISQALQENLQRLLQVHNIPKSEQEALYRGLEWHCKVLELEHIVQKRYEEIILLLQKLYRPQ